MRNDSRKVTNLLLRLVLRPVVGMCLSHFCTPQWFVRWYKPTVNACQRDERHMPPPSVQAPSAARSKPAQWAVTLVPPVLDLLMGCVSACPMNHCPCLQGRHWQACHL